MKKLFIFCQNIFQENLWLGQPNPLPTNEYSKLSVLQRQKLTLTEYFFYFKINISKLNRFFSFGEKMINKNHLCIIALALTNLLASSLAFTAAHTKNIVTISYESLLRDNLETVNFERQSLPDARKNLARVSGVSNLNNIPYLTRLYGRAIENEHKIGFEDWVIRLNDGNNLLPIAQETAMQLAQWASSNDFDAIIWATHSSVPAHTSPEEGLQYANLTYYQRGNIPVVLSAPHGGQNHPSNIPTRIGRSPITGFKVSQVYGKFYTDVWDDGTLELAQEVSKILESTYGIKPYIVAADFARAIIDANRPGGLRGAQAYESTKAEPFYNFYHNKLDEFTTEVKRNYDNKGLFLDLHGHGFSSSHCKVTFVGTRLGKTVNNLKDHVRPTGVIGYMADKGHQMTLVTTDNIGTFSGYNGGYITETYGRLNNKIDAIQLEIGSVDRNRDRTKYAQDLADAIYQYVCHFND